MTTTTSFPQPRPRSKTPQPPAPGVPRLLGEEISAVALMLGAVSIVTFWMFGFGIALGAGAIAVGIFAVRHPTTASNEPKSLEALIGILTGAFGINASIYFLLAASPHL